MRTFKSYAKTKSSPLLRPLIAVVALFILVFSPILTSPAFADEDKGEEIVDEFVGDDDFDESFQKANKEIGGAPNKIKPDGFPYLLYRVLAPSYMNEVSDATPAKGMPGPLDLQEPNYLCSVLAKNEHGNIIAGTPLYHNCDIPNMTAELFQTINQAFFPMGIQNGGVEQSRLFITGFGLPSTIPNGEVPANIDSSSQYKYTGLEVFGYNLRYTYYTGEWDNIKTMNKTRMLSLFHVIKIGWNTMVKKVTAAFTGAVEGASAGMAKGWEESGLFGAIGGFFTGAVKGAIEGAGEHSLFKAILDSSDLNLYNSDGWYRANYGSHSYGVRDKTTAEKQEELLAMAEAYLSSDNPDEVGYDPEIAELMGKTPTDAYDEQDNLLTYEEWRENPKVNGEYYDYFKEHDLATDDCPLPSRGTENDSKKKFSECANDIITEKAESEREKGWRESIGEWITGKSKTDNFREWFVENNQDNFNAPWNNYVCITLEGRDVKQQDGDNEGHLKNAYDEEGNYHCNLPARPPIQDALYGNGYAYEQLKPLKDTRHTSNSGMGGGFATVLGIDKMMNDTASQFLGISAFFTRISNTVLNLSFSPIFEELGLNDIVENLIENFRDGIFMPLLVMAVAGGGLYILWQAGTRRNYGEQAKNAVLIFFTAFMGVVVLYSPQTLLLYSEKIPAMIETTIMGTIFETGREEDSKLCTATGTKSVPNDNEGIDPSQSLINPEAAVRQMMCENWQVYVYSPYVFGQWGTSYNSLHNNKMKNIAANEQTVGKASVRLGPGPSGELNNWAAYQTSLMTAGSTTTIDGNKHSGLTNPNMYRIVDLQAGPNNGWGTDDTYFNSWRGENMFDRVMTSFLSIGSSIMGMIVVIAYSLKLIELKLVTTLMLTIMPFMFLMGIIPGQGRMKLKKYFMTLIVLMIQRVLLVALLAIMMRVLTGLALSAEGYFLLAIFSIVVPLVFLKYRSELLSLVKKAADSAGGSYNTPKARQMASAATQAVPTSVRNVVSTQRAALAGGIAGAMAGAARGSVSVTKDKDGNNVTKVHDRGLDGARAGFRNAAREQRQIQIRRNRRAGLGAAQKHSRIHESVRSSEMNRFGETSGIQIKGLEKDLRDAINARRAEWKLPPLDSNVIFNYENIAQSKEAVSPLTTMAEKKIAIANTDRKIDELRESDKSNDELLNDPKTTKAIEKLLKKRAKLVEDYEYNTEELMDVMAPKSQGNIPLTNEPPKAQEKKPITPEQSRDPFASPDRKGKSGEEGRRK